MIEVVSGVIFATKEARLATAARFGVDRTTIRNIQNGRGWTWLTGAPGNMKALSKLANFVRTHR